MQRNCPSRLVYNGTGRFLVLSFLLVLFLNLSPVGADVLTPKSSKLTLLNWADYMDPEVLRKFEKEFGIEVEEIYYESDNHRNSLLAATNGTGYDVIVMDSPMIRNYNKRGWLAPVPEPAPQNFRFLDNRWEGESEGAVRHAIPWFWGTLGIAYRGDVLNYPYTHWSQFFRPAPDLPGKLAMLNSGHDVIGMALKSLGYSMNSSRVVEIHQAVKLLKKQKPFVDSYEPVSLDRNSRIVSGDVVAAMMYSCDARILQEVDSNIRFIVPEEGGQIWVDHLAVLASSSKQKMAWDFVNFLHRPKIAASIAQYVKCAPINLEAEKHLSEEFLQNEVIYPNEETLEKSELPVLASPRALNRINRLYISLTLNGS